jgi:hypothetical protein
MKVIVVIFLGAVLSGCTLWNGDDGLLRNRSRDYKQAHEVGILNVPAELSVKSLSADYHIFTLPEGTAQNYIDDPVPPGFDLK